MSEARREGWSVPNGLTFLFEKDVLPGVRLTNFWPP